MINSRSSLTLFIGLLLVFFLSAESFAVKYRYRYGNEKGEVFFAEDLQSVPERHRGQAMIVSTEDIDEKAQLSAEQERAQSAAAVQAADQKRAEEQLVAAQASVTMEPRSHARIAWTAGVVSACIIAFIALARIKALRKHEQAVERARSVLALLILGSVVVAYGGDVVGLFRIAGETVAGVERKSAERGRKTAQFYKEIEKMMEQAASAQNEQDAQIETVAERQ